MIVSDKKQEPIFNVSPSLYEKLVAFQQELESPAPPTPSTTETIDSSTSPSEENHEHPSTSP